MCWYNYKIIHPKIATEDIQVYKIVINFGNNVSSGVYSFKWESGIVYQSKISIETYYNQMEITKGFHTLRDRPCITGNYWYTSNGHLLFIALPYHIVFKAIIPKGSTYYENEYGEIVSNKLKLLYGCN